MIRSQPHFPLYPKQAAVALTIARETALRFKDSSQIGTALTLAKEQTAFPKSVYWRPYGIAQGYAGLAVMCGYLDACFPDERWDIIGHQYLEIATRGVEKQTQVPTGLFAGLSGLAFAVWYLSYQGTRYGKLLAALEERLLPQVGALAQQLTRQKQGLPVQQFDLISGLTGVGTYLLCRREEPRPACALQSILRCFTALLLSESKGIPCWHTPAHQLEEATRQYYPNGNLNCGLAHGIPGPLALLSLAYREGVEVDGLPESIERVADWLCQNFLEDEWGINWPNAVPLASDQTAVASSVRALRGSRAGWCYSSPGVARSLWLAGQALNRTDYQEQAIAAMEAVYRRPLNVRNIDSPTFCHGVAGLLQISLRFARDTRLPLFSEAVENLSEQLVSLYEPESLLGYRCLEPGNRGVDKPGLLDGAPGVVLVLLAVATDIEPAWDRLFLLS